MNGLIVGSSFEALSQIIADLHSKNADIQEQASLELRAYIDASSRELSQENSTKLLNDVNRRIFDLIHSSDNNDRVGGILAIDKLIDYDGEDNSTKFTRFANYLRKALPGNDPRVTLLAAKALGKLAIPAGTLTTEFVEFEVKRAIEWLQGDRNEHRRLAAVLVLKELAVNAPTLLYVHVPTVIDLLWVALRDGKAAVREAGARCLSAFLEIIYQRESSFKVQWYRQIFDEAQKGLKLNAVDTIHGSLLTYRELLLHTGRGNFMQERYQEACDTIFKYKDHKDNTLRKTVIQLIPTLAMYNPAEFVTMHLGRCMNHLLNQLKKERERSYAFVAIGDVALAVVSNMGPYLEAITQAIREALAVKTRNRLSIETSIYSCIHMLATAVGPALTKNMHDLLDLMFAGILTEPLRQALVGLAQHIPPLLPKIQDRLLNGLSIILSGQPYRPPGAPGRTFTHGNPTTNTTLREFQDVKEEETILLALTTLGSFNFSGHLLSEFVRDCVIMYLEDDSRYVRKAAAITCCQVFKIDPIAFHASSNRIQIVEDVLEKLLTVGIADPDPSIRQTVLASLDERFDRQLAQPENVRSLFIALNDEVFAIREIAMTVVGRVAVYNPAYVMPLLRKTLIQLLTELEYSTMSRNKEESAKLLCHLVASSKRLVKPYVEPVLNVLLPKLRDGSPGVATAILNSLSELAQVGGDDLILYLDDLMPTVIDILSDQSWAAKRGAALRTLGEVASNTGFVITPYLQYPTLLNVLIQIIKGEQSVSIRRETIKLIGILGALDPYQHKMPSSSSFDEAYLLEGSLKHHELQPASTGPTTDDYYPNVVISALLKVLRDPSLSVHHTAVIAAIMHIFNTLGLKCVNTLHQIMPPFLSSIRASPMLEFNIQQLGILASIVKQHIRNFLPEIFALIQEFWNTPSIHITLISLIEAIASALEAEFKIYVPNLLPPMLELFETDLSENRLPTQKVLHTLSAFGANIEEYMHLVIPVVVKLFEKPDVGIPIRKLAIQKIGDLSGTVDFKDHASRIIHPLGRVLIQPYPELRVAALETLCALVLQMKSDYIVFIPMINKALAKYHVQHPMYDSLIGRLLKNEPLPSELGPSLLSEIQSVETTTNTIQSQKLPVNQKQLKKTWEAHQSSTKDDWNEWIRRLSVELLKESPSHALRACTNLASVYPPLARELFNAGFISCWGELYDQFQDELVKALETALVSPTIPPEILQMLLNLAEFMEHDDKPLPIDIRTLGGYAAKCHAYAKALHYKEMEFIAEPTTDTIEALISINNQLQQPDAAVGILSYAQKNHTLELKELWYEKLNRWDDALLAYDTKRKADPANFELILGRMRCLHALGVWDTLSVTAHEHWTHGDDDHRSSIAPLAAAAAWGMSDWESMDDYIAYIKQNTPDGAFFRAILALHRNQFSEAELFIDQTRQLLDGELTALVGESYNRAYSVVVRVQMLAELEEIITFKQYSDQPDRQEMIQRTWSKRLKGCQPNVEVWQRILKVRNLVLSPSEDMDIHIKFANLCRRNGRLNLSANTLQTLVKLDDPNDDVMREDVHPQIIYAYLKHAWAAGSKETALKALIAFTGRLSSTLGVDVTHNTPSSPKDRKSAVHSTKLLARCFLKRGEWQMALQDDWDEKTLPDILTSFRLATHYDQDWYKAWHAWAYANFEVIHFHERRSDFSPTYISPDHIVPSVHGFFRSIGLSKSSSLQDTLRLLTLWFKHGYQSEVAAAISEGFNSVSIDTWLQVIPQLIARIHAPNPIVRRLNHQLLSDVGRIHPQALIYSLTVASKSQSVSRKKSALAIMDKMRVHEALLVEQALLVGHELIRVAILWHEMWHEGLEEASRLYFGDGNIQAMYTTLEPLHEVLERGPETLREISFNQAFGRDLQEAQAWSRKYKTSKDINDINQAWDLYYQVFRKIRKHLPQLTTLELQYVSPKLLEAQNLELAVPGTYRSGEPVVRITCFVSTLTVITSKQRPRRLTITGSNGQPYQYLLKGHEDLRQDERVMQLFGLVNTLLKTDAETYKRHLSIHQYPVIPLSPNSGLIGLGAQLRYSTLSYS